MPAHPPAATTAPAATPAATGMATAVMLSIIVPVLDEAEEITHHLRDLAALRAQGHEVIVVDGGSQDATLALCQGLADQVISAPRGRARPSPRQEAPARRHNHGQRAGPESESELARGGRHVRGAEIQLSDVSDVDN